MKPDVISDLFCKYHNDALLYVYSLCKNPELAEDIVADSFFKAFTSADDSVYSFKAWLLTVCRNEYYSYCRKHQRVVSELDENILSDSRDIIDEIIRDEQYRALYRAISMISEEQREVITLFYFSEMSIREIAQTTGKGENNVKVLLHRSRKSLRKILEIAD